jgi:drug/metabolite transporter (DMT)-like permease
MPNGNNKISWVVYAKLLFAVAAWGASFIATKIALGFPILLPGHDTSLISSTKIALADVSPVTVVWLRFAMGVAILGAAVIARRQFAIPKSKDLVYFSLLGFIGITFHQWLQSTGLQTAMASTTAWIVATTPVFMALLGYLLLKERLGWMKISGILLAGLGVLLVVTQGDFSSLLEGRFGAPGDFLILISAPNWAVFSVLSRRGLQTHPAARMMLYVMGFGWLFTTLLLLSGPGLAEIGALTLTGWLGVVFLGVACSGLAYIFWYDGLQAIPASQVGAFLYLEPLVAVIVAAILLQEAILLASLVGGAIILLGVWMVNRNGPAVRTTLSRRSGFQARRNLEDRS